MVTLLSQSVSMRPRTTRTEVEHGPGEGEEERGREGGHPPGGAGERGASRRPPQLSYPLVLGCHARCI